MDLWFQLKEASLQSTAVSSSSWSGSDCGLSSPSKRLLGLKSSRVHGRHVHQAGYQQLMDIINLPRRNSTTQSSNVLNTTDNHRLETPCAKVASASASSVGICASRSVQSVEDRDKTLKPMDILDQLVDTL